jgi:Zn-finger nucleic acid-binding protein
MECPKDRTVTLSDGFLSGDLAVKHCPECQGNWIPPDEYDRWKISQEQREVPPTQVARERVDNFVPARQDMKAGLCPECKRYLSRAKVMVRTPFYVERCPSCGGIWCDRGEWELLEELGLHDTLEQLFSSDWQAQVRSVVHADKERLATIDKLGPEVAEMVFELAEVLENHPNGDFGVAYLMRRFDKPQ